jgi:hypothetical protein
MYTLNLWPALSLNTDRFMKSKLIYEKDVKNGYKAWYGRGKANGDAFRDNARLAWQDGLVSY